MSNELIGNLSEIKIIEWQGNVVITTKDIAIYHELELRIINQKFRRNRDHFEVNKDYFIITREDIPESPGMIQKLFVVNNQTEIYLFTKRGYFKLVKTINDDKAWDVYDQLLKAYFHEDILTDVDKKYLKESIPNRNSITGQWKQHEAKNYSKLTITEYTSLFDNPDIRKKQMDDKQLSLLSAFEFLETRKLENNIHIKGDNQLSESLQSTAKQINEIIKPKEIISHL